ncbi:MAG: thiamine-phosphate kinase [Bryobacteraceae bacterium]|nr:thiamine-phosphate kinase [Bryobacteraceae bacterium]MDW8378653.1 thiamine-phosphate kinase [Bryobacterales bacterium]
MNELELVERIRRRAAKARNLVLGIGDDCAIYQPAAGEQLLFTTDLLIEGVHFLRETHQPSDCGWKALARGLSDIAAMGGRPRFCLTSLALPGWATTRWAERFYDGLFELARLQKTVLVGGDLARAETIVCDVVVCGSVPEGQALRRDGARPGDAIYVSGLLGGSALGLAQRRGPAFRRHLRPEPRLKLGIALREKLKVTAAMDLSDGLSLDLHRLCVASGVAAELDGDLPLWPGATLDQALHGGEDYELLFTLSSSTRPPRQLAGVPLTRIGTIVGGRPGVVRLGGRELPLAGFDHFRNPQKPAAGR